MKEIPLSRGEVALVDDEDFGWLNRHKWYCTYHAARKGEYSGLKYAERKTGPKKRLRTLRMHREILKAPPGKVVDHINGNGLDNRRENLRLCTQQGNSANGRGWGGTSEYRGVYWHKKMERWVAQIRVNGRKMRLGSFESEKKAARAYDCAAHEHFGEFARFNLAPPA